MRNFINIVESNQRDFMKTTWTWAQDRDGIYVIRPSSNTVYAGFRNQIDAEKFSEQLGEPCMEGSSLGNF